MYGSDRMIKSMTGYGKASYKDDNLTIHMEIKSVNHRYLDISVRMPQVFLEYEDQLRQAIRALIKRGKVDLYVTIESESLYDKEVQVNFHLLESYIQTFENIKRLHNVTTPLSLDHILQLPDVLTVVEKENKSSTLEEALLDTCSTAVRNLVTMRENEGEMLYKKIVKNLENVTQCLQKIKARSEELEPAFQKRLYDKLNELLLEQMEIDESRILTEVAIMSEKTNIQEEITRLESHCVQFYAVLEEKESIGRKLDFLIQEMNREINTIGSKGNDLDINREVINIKSELEMIREQIQNIE